MLFLATVVILSSLGLGHKIVERKMIPSDAGSHVWRVDLRSVGFTGFAPKQEQWGLNLRQNPVAFSANSVLIATFITHEEVTTLARRDKPGDVLPLRLHAVFLNVDASKIQVTKEWSITRPRGGIVANGHGGFVLLTPGLIAVYSSSVELVNKLDLSSKQQSDLWDFHTSPTGKSILIEYHRPETSFQWMDASSLRSELSWDETMGFGSISDGEIAFSRETFVKSTGFIHEVLLRPRVGPEQTICRGIAGRGDSCGTPQFVSNDVLALLMPHELSVVPRTGGDALLKASFHDDEWLGRPLHPSADGQRFAVTVWAHKGGNAFFDIDSHSVLKRIVVYDLPSSRAVYTLDAKQRKIKNVSGVALSPDGSLLAVLTDGVVEVYRVPAL